MFLLVTLYPRHLSFRLILNAFWGSQVFAIKIIIFCSRCHVIWQIPTFWGKSRRRWEDNIKIDLREVG
jgi:hypothetical protein